MFNTILVIISLIVSFFAGVLFLFSTTMAFNISTHPIASLLMRLVFAGLIVILIVLRKKENFIYLFLVCFPFLRISFNGISLFSLLSFVLFALYYKDIFAYKVNRKHICRYGFLIILIAILYTTILAKRPLESFKDATGIFCLFVIYIVLNKFLSSEQNSKFFFIILNLIYLFAILISFLQVLFGANSIKLFFGEYYSNVNSSFDVRRMPSFFIDAQEAGIYFAVMGIISLGLGNTYFKKSVFGKWVFLLGSVALLFNGTRIAIIALLCGLIVLFLLKITFKKIFFMGFIFFIFFICGSIFFQYFPDQVKSRFRRDNLETSLNYRSTMWQGSLPIFYHYPFGVGLGRMNTYDACIASGARAVLVYSDKFNSNLKTQFESTYLEIIYSLGIIGFTGFLLMIGSFFKAGIRINYEQKDCFKKELSIYLLIAMIVWLISVSTSPKLDYSQTMLIFTVLMVLINKYSMSKIEEELES